MSVSKEWKLIKSALKRTYNRTVKDYFSDVDDEELEDLTLPRKVLKRCSYIMPKDSMISAILKQQFFWFIVQQLHLKPDLIAGIPKSQYDELYKYKPMITMFFRQDPDAVPDGFYAVEGTISFRLINETTESITEAKLISLANEIKQNFGLNGGYIWKKGKQKYTYKDLEKGLDLRILSISETEAKEVIQKVCDIANATYDDDKLTPIVPNRNSINTPGTQMILGETYKQPRWRPTANCRFKNAKISIHGLPHHRYLVDLTGRNNALVIF